MTIIQAIFLGIIQGLTEFLPISSSGHLKLLQYFFDFANPKDYIFFDLVCHLGTLTAIFVMFRQKIREMFTTNRIVLWQLFLGTVPLFFIAVIIKQVKEIYNDPRFLGPFFLFTAFLLFAAIRLGKNRDLAVLHKNRYRDPVIIGVFQALAVFPGVSRSGATISASKLLGWSWSDAVTFSFLLAIPAILGGTAFEILGILTHQTTLPSIGFIPYATGFVFSLVVGYGALALLINLAAKEKFMYFVWYCLVLGIGTLLYFNLT